MDKSEAAAVLGRLGGLARKKKLSPEERRAIAKRAIAARWKKAKERKQK